MNKSDEILYCLPYDNLVEYVPLVEQAMIAGMKTVTPHMKVSVETSVMYHWDKGATELIIKDGIAGYEDKEEHAWKPFDRLPDGRYIIPEPKFVTEVYSVI